LLDHEDRSVSSRRTLNDLQPRFADGAHRGAADLADTATTAAALAAEQRLRWSAAMWIGHGQFLPLQQARLPCSGTTILYAATRPMFPARITSCRMPRRRRIIAGLTAMRRPPGSRTWRALRGQSETCATARISASRRPTSDDPVCPSTCRPMWRSRSRSGPEPHSERWKQSTLPGWATAACSRTSRSAGERL
jgi:hypothetical protein